MGLYIYLAGTAYIIVSEVSTPPASISITELNGSVVSPAMDADLLVSCADIEAALHSTSADAQSVIDAMRQYVTDAGGFAALSAGEQKIAACYGIGTNPQRSAVIPNATLKTAYDNRNIEISNAASVSRNALLMSLAGDVSSYAGAYDYIITDGNVDTIVY